MTQAIDQELQAYITLLNNNQKESLLGVIKSFLQPADKEGRISKAQYNREIDEAEQRMDAGHFLTHEELEKEAAEW